MKISLCLLVKDEERTIEDCLAPIHDLFDDIVVMDTGSTDRTCELLRDRFGLNPHHGKLEERQCFAKFGLRNRLVEHARHPWILFLDADERITREQARTMLDTADDPTVSGYCCAWNTFIDGTMIEDYKLPLFRREALYTGLVHENIQQHLRRHGRRAAWLDEIAILHYPEPAKLEDKRRLYRSRLLCALAHDDAWYRYHWFMGYALYRGGELDDAGRYLATVVASRSRDFPVECLNSHMVLAKLHADRGDADAAVNVVTSALNFHREMADDFEVRANFRLKPWLDAALVACLSGKLEQIEIYDFAY